MTILYPTIGLLLVVLYIYCYNRLVSAKQNAQQALAGIDVQLKRRSDLIPNLVQVVQGYATHEKELFEHIAKMRTKALATPKNDVDNVSNVEHEIGTSLKSIIALSEAYPELKANEQYLKLQSQLGETEDQIASARRIYNSNVTDYNTMTATFPLSIIAMIHGFTLLPLFQNS
ncbi:LemA family protein [soil metagenome]